MKLLWLTNSMPGVVKAHITGQDTGAVNWVDHVLSDLRKQGFKIRILCRGPEATGIIDDTCSYRCFGEDAGHMHHPDLDKLFRVELRSFKPDVIHSWGTEYAHILSITNAAEQENMLDKLVASIQGLCSVCAVHYAEGIPYAVQRRGTFRDIIRRDNILQQKQKFVLRGQNEVAALKKIRHVIGRTDWDRACALEINPDVQYHFCNETLREPFYEGAWDYSKCKKHHIFASGCNYPVKGFHYLLEAMAMVKREYPDVTLAVPGKSFLTGSALRQSGYQKYLADLTRKYGLEDRITFLGSCTAQQMKDAFLEANVFALPSTIENSPNSLGEAMLLGVPCVAADVGGVKNLLKHGEEGYVYQSTAPYMLAYYIRQVFALEEEARHSGARAAVHGAKTHDPEKNLRDLIEIYESIR